MGIDDIGSPSASQDQSDRPAVVERMNGDTAEEPRQASPTRTVALVDGVSAGMPLGPTLSLREPRLTVTIVGSDGSAPSPEASWSSLPAVRPEDLPRSAVAAIARTVAEHTGAAPWPARRPSWFRSGWLDAVDAWIDEQLAASDLVRAGPCRPVRMWSLSAVLRVPICDDRSVWFKATCEHFRDEPAITRTLGRFAGEAVPRVLAVDERYSWMLLAPLPETDTDNPCRVVAAAAAMARIQVEAIAHVDELRAAGCPDRGLRATLDAFGHLVHDSVELERLTPARREAAVATVPWVKRRLEDFFGCGIVGHPGRDLLAGEHLSVELNGQLARLVVGHAVNPETGVSARIAPARRSRLARSRRTTQSASSVKRLAP